VKLKAEFTQLDIVKALLYDLKRCHLLCDKKDFASLCECGCNNVSDVSARNPIRPISMISP